MREEKDGFLRALEYSLFDAIFHRRSRRVMRGVKAVHAGSLTYRSRKEPEPLSELEEALLIAATGTTGVTLPDRPFQDEEGKPILGAPNLSFIGRAAGSTDNAQATYFFLINDTGTYFLRRTAPPAAGAPLTKEALIQRAREAKVQLSDRRIEFPRRFPYYLDSNRFLSNLPGSTILVPVVDMTTQYINALMYLLTEEQGQRPTLVDDRNFYTPAGVTRWVLKGFLNPKIPLPLGALGTMRTHVEAELLLQNLMLALQAMGLGGWIHASVAPPYLLGNPYMTDKNRGLAFRWYTPPRGVLQRYVLDMIRWHTFMPRLRAHPVGLEKDGEPLIRCMSPPYYTDMADAVDAVVATKFDTSRGVYTDREFFRQIFKGQRGDRYIAEVPHYDADVIACTKDICRYIVRTHGRFPAHVDAIYVPGIWLQAHHLDLDYYDENFRDGYSETQASHMTSWHGRHEDP